MSKSRDLVRKIDSKIDDVSKKKAERTPERTEVQEAIASVVESALFGAKPRARPAEARPRIILGIDCTASMGEYIAQRKITLDMASTIANSLFTKAGPAGLEVQLCYFRGNDRSFKQPRKFQSSDWYSTPKELARAIAAVEHWPGWTQHCRVLRHAVAEAEKQPVQQVVIVSDAFETRTPLRPDGDDLQAALVHARRLRDLGTGISVGYKGTIRNACPLDRAGISAEEAFRHIVEENHGVVFLLNPADLAERFGEIGKQATLQAMRDTVGAQLLLEHRQAIPFELELNVVGEVLSAKCKPSSQTTSK